MYDDKHKLILFDIDGTLRDWETGGILPGVEAFINEHGGDHYFAFVTNQGGVGLRYWMERDGFGEPERYPTEELALNEIYEFLALLPPMGKGETEPTLYICYAYQSKKSGKWSPVPDGKMLDPEWSSDYRKPNPGMLLKAMADLNLEPGQCLMVGDKDEDYGAAEAAGCAFEWADQFFDREFGIGAV